MSKPSHSHPLPLPIREHLMRNQMDAGVAELMQLENLSESQAQDRIEQYRAELKQKRLELEIRIVQEKQAKEELKERSQKIVWGLRIALAVILLTGLLLSLKYFFTR